MKTKLEQFIKRNRKRNGHLYNESLINGIDYIICPASNERLSMIKKTYIENVLEMTVDEYDRRYPGIRGVSETRKNNIKDGLHRIDLDTGLSKYTVGQLKAREILQRVDTNGKTGYKRKGEKTRATHMNNIDHFGRNGYSQLATKAISKGNATKAKKGLILDPSLRNEFYRYKSIVTYLTERCRNTLSTGYTTGLAGTVGAYHIDHIYSIMHGYKHKVSPLVIGNINNLRMIPWEENLSKHASSSIDINHLLRVSGYTVEQSILEFELTLNLITIDIKNNAPVSGARIANILYETKLPT